jgi:transketolase
MKALSTVSLARRIRIDALRMTSLGGSSHIGAIFSCADLLAVLYGRFLRIDPERPRSPKRDRFVMSKGHAAAGLYAALAETGFFPSEKLWSHYQDGSDLCGHVTHHLPGIEVSTGALGHGLGIAAGMAYAGHLAQASYRVVCLMSDGECDEGSVWEAVLFAAQHRLANLTVVIDYNRIQGIAPIGDVLELEPFADKWRSFGWLVAEVNGHDHIAVEAALQTGSQDGDRPNCIIARTTKGKGVSFMENTVLWHYRIPRGEEYDAALAELEPQQ